MFTKVRPKQMDSWLAQFAGQGPITPGAGCARAMECEVVRLPNMPALRKPSSHGDIPARWQDGAPPPTPHRLPVPPRCPQHGRVAAYLAQQGFAHVANITGGSTPGRTSATQHRLLLMLHDPS